MRLLFSSACLLVRADFLSYLNKIKCFTDGAASPLYSVLMRNFHVIEERTLKFAFFTKAHPVEKLAAKSNSQ